MNRSVDSKSREKELDDPAHRGESQDHGRIQERQAIMARTRHTSEQIITKLREAEVLLAQGKAVPAVCKHIGVAEQTYYRWRKEYGGMKVDQAKRLKDLEKENARLKKLVAELSLDKQMLQEVAGGRLQQGIALNF